MKKILLTLGSLLLAGSLSAQWVKVDDLESYTVDTELDPDADPAVSTGDWNYYRSADDQYSVLPFFGVRADPFGGGQGNVLELHPGVPSAEGQGNTTLERALPDEAKIKDPLAGGGDMATFYFKMARPIVDGSPGEADNTWGLVAEEARDATTGIHAYGSYSVLGRIEIDGIIDIRNGGDYIDLTTAALETQTWYEFWFVIDHGANTFTQYIKGGTDFPTQTKLQPEDAAYRFATFADLETILLVTTTGAADSRKAKDPIYFDDFHVDPNAENLNSPGGAAPTWVKVDDLESYTVDTELDPDADPAVSTGDWNYYRSADDQYSVLPFFGVRADPFGAGQGQVLELHPGVPSAEGQGNTTLERALPDEAKIKDPLAGGGDMATFYFKMARPIVDGSPGEADNTWGLVAEEARDATTGIHAYGSYSVLGRIEIDGIIDIRNGGDYIDLTTAALETQTWYEFWFVVNHGANTFTQYIKGGTDFPAQTKLQPEDAAYRFATFGDLETILLVTTTGAADSRKAKDPIYFDDFFVDPTGENLSSPGTPPPPPPAWVTVDDMESYTVDTEVDPDADPAVSTGPWNYYRSADDQYSVLPFFGVRADPFGAGQGNVLELHPGVPSAEGQGNTTLERALPDEAKIKDPLAGGGDMATFYFRMARPIVDGSPGEADNTWGLVAEEARDATTGIHAYGSYSVLGRIEIDGIIDIRNGGDYIDLTTAALETQTWYEFWFVVNHGANTFTQYIKGGSDFPEQTKLQPEDAAYRFATFGDLETILLVTTTGAADSRKAKDPIYFDDFHVDPTGVNLTSPGAPVVDTTPRAVGEDAGSTTITMTGDSVADAEVGDLVFDDAGTELGKIASISGQVITLEAPLAAAIAPNARLTFVVDTGIEMASGGKLINISTRGVVGTGDDVLIGSLIIGVDSQTVLIQAVGQELAGVSGTLPDPILELRNPADNSLIATNDNWEDTQKQEITDVWGGNPPLAEGSTSAAILITLDQGSYSGIVIGKDGGTGVALIEIYEID